MSDQCETCRFWSRRTDDAADMGGGYCRRFPPTFPNGEGFLNDGWPYVHQQQWCGEYQRRFKTDFGTMGDLT